MGREEQPSIHTPSFLRRTVHTIRQFRQSDTALQTSATITIASLMTSAAIEFGAILSHNEVLLDITMVTGVIGAIGYIDARRLQRNLRRNRFSDTLYPIIDLEKARKERRGN